MIKLVKMKTKSFEGSRKHVAQRWTSPETASERLAQTVNVARPSALDCCLCNLDDYDALRVMMKNMLLQ